MQSDEQEPPKGRVQSKSFDFDAPDRFISWQNPQISSKVDILIGIRGLLDRPAPGSQQDHGPRRRHGRKHDHHLRGSSLRADNRARAELRSAARGSVGAAVGVRDAGRVAGDEVGSNVWAQEAGASPAACGGLRAGSQRPGDGVSDLLGGVRRWGGGPGAPLVPPWLPRRMRRRVAVFALLLPHLPAILARGRQRAAGAGHDKPIKHCQSIKFVHVDDGCCSFHI